MAKIILIIFVFASIGLTPLLVAFIINKIDDSKTNKQKQQEKEQRERDSIIPNAEDAKVLASMYREKELKIAFDYINQKINKAIRAGKTEVNLANHCSVCTDEGVYDVIDILSELSSVEEIKEYYSGYKVQFCYMTNKPRIKSISWKE